MPPTELPALPKVNDLFLTPKLHFVVVTATRSVKDRYFKDQNYSFDTEIHLKVLKYNLPLSMPFKDFLALLDNKGLVYRGNLNEDSLLKTVYL